METEEQVLDLLALWEERREEGLDATAEELCPNDSSMRDKLQIRIERRRKIHRALGLAEPSVIESLPDFSWLSPPEHPEDLGRLGEYRILKVLGKGGMGIAFEAEDIQLRRRVALKAMLPEVAKRRGACERFLREARAVAALDHPHIVAIHQVGEDHGVPFLIMPLLKGESLAKRLAREKPFPIPEVVRIGLDIAEGLAAAHDEGLIHRDIKPANIWLETRQKDRPKTDPNARQLSDPAHMMSSLSLSNNSTSRVKILDFGLAQPREEAGQITQLGVILGTPSYMAPEQARGKTLDARADLFSLGCILYELATGHRAFAGPDTMAILTSLAVDTPPPAHEANDEVPLDLSAFIHKLLEKNPDNRPASAHDAVFFLEFLANLISMTANMPIAESPPPQDESSHSASRSWIWVGIAISGSIGLGWYLLRP